MQAVVVPHRKFIRLDFMSQTPHFNLICSNSCLIPPPWELLSSVCSHCSTSLVEVLDKTSAHLFIPRRNSKSLCPSGTLKTLITVPCRGERFCIQVNELKKRREKHRTSPPHLLGSTGQLCTRCVEREGREGTVVSLDQRQGGLKEEEEEACCVLMTFPRDFTRAKTRCLSNAGSPNHWHRRGWFLRSWHCQGTPGRSYCGWQTERRDLRESAEDRSGSPSLFTTVTTYQQRYAYIISQGIVLYWAR